MPARAAGRCLVLAGLALAMPAQAEEASRSVPLSDTEDAGLGSHPAGGGVLHAVVGLDVRNGDFVRGSYDDDGAGLGRLPVHAQLGLVLEVARDGDGRAVWLEARTSNGFHAPHAGEPAAPRAWYESNNLVGIAARVARDATVALTYAVKTSPNGGSATTHELSLAWAWQGSTGLGWLRPGAAATWRPKGGGGWYAQATAAPGADLGGAPDAGRVSMPVAIGIGWNGFYAPGSGSRLFGSLGVAYEHPLRFGATRWRMRAELSGLLRDRGLRRLDPASVSRAALRPYATLSMNGTF